MNDNQVTTQADALRQMVENAVENEGDLPASELTENASLSGNATEAGAAVKDGAAMHADDVLMLSGEVVISEDGSQSAQMRGMLSYEPTDYPPTAVGRALSPEENRILSDVFQREGTFAEEHPDFFDANGNLRPETDTAELLKAVSDAVSKNPQSAPQMKEIFSKAGYPKLVTQMIANSMTLAPEELKEPHKLDDLYRQIDANMTKLASAASHLTGGEENAVTRAAAEIHDNLDFISQVNDLYSYIQIPLQLSGQNATGDLYVYRNKKQNKNENDELSAFLHFDMEHLGSTDISVKMKQKNVNTRFYLADDGAFELIMNNIHILKENLDHLGYNCTIECENDAREHDFVSDFLERDVKTTENISRYSFDVRA